MKTVQRFVVSVFCALMIAPGCAILPQTVKSDAHQYQRTESFAVPQTKPGRIQKVLSGPVKQHARLSGFHILETASESMLERIALLQSAQHTIDLQYYTVNDDLTSNLFLKAAMDAANRGVRVRFLIDGVSLDDAGDCLAALDAEKNIEIRIFNPVSTPALGPISWLMRMTTDVGHATRRMHNKAMVVDNQIAILGGRNLGDEYFEAAPDLNFRDIDMLIAGPVVAQVSNSFDTYWNGRNSFPIEALSDYDFSAESALHLRQRLDKEWQAYKQTPDGRVAMDSRFTNQKVASLVWAQAEIVADDPEKINHDPKEDNSRPFNRLVKLMRAAKKEFVMTSPYLVPKDEGVQLLSDLVDRNVRVKVLTNSLSSTDMVVAHAGYKDYREDLLKAGVSLYEMKARGGKDSTSRSPTEAPANAVVHTKSYVVDREHIMMGSFNYDPRSINHNTEIAIIIHSKVIGEKIIYLLDQFTKPENVYAVRLKPGSDDQIEWITRENGRTMVYDQDPKASTGRRVKSTLYGLLPIDDYL